MVLLRLQPAQELHSCGVVEPFVAQPWIGNRGQKISFYCSNEHDEAILLCLTTKLAAWLEPAANQSRQAAEVINGV